MPAWLRLCRSKLIVKLLIIQWLEKKNSVRGPAVSLMGWVRCEKWKNSTYSILSILLFCMTSATETVLNRACRSSAESLH
jgi:hypothetical protein